MLAESRPARRNRWLLRGRRVLQRARYWIRFVQEASELPEEGDTVVAAKAAVPSGRLEDLSVSEGRALPVVPEWSPDSEPPLAINDLPENRASSLDKPPSPESRWRSSTRSV